MITFDGKSIHGSRASSDEMAGIAKLSSALVSISHPSLLFSFPALLCEFSSLGKPSRSLDSEETLSTIFHARSNVTSGSWKTSIRKRNRVLILGRKYITAYSSKLLEFMMNLIRFIYLFILFNDSLFFFRQSTRIVISIILKQCESGYVDCFFFLLIKLMKKNAYLLYLDIIKEKRKKVE